MESRIKSCDVHGGMTQAEFSRLSYVAKKKFGLHLSDGKLKLVQSRVSKRVRTLNLNSFSEYLEFLEVGDESEVDELASALTTNVSSFFREGHHFDVLKTELLPNLKTAAENGGRVRIWSAGCSSGEEAYSIAATVMDEIPNAATLDVKILATDIDRSILSKAVAGIYSDCELGGVSEMQKISLFKTRPAPGSRCSIDQSLRKIVNFGVLNLVGEWPTLTPFDAIFCRNVAIYFDQDVQSRLWGRFEDLLVDGGVLFLGHSEKLSGSSADSFLKLDMTTYRKGTSETLEGM